MTRTWTTEKSLVAASLLLLLLAVYARTLAGFVDGWHDEENAHGWLVVPLTLFLVWMNWPRLRRVPVRGRPAAGLTTLGLALLVQVAGVWLGLNRSVGYSFVFAVAGLCLYFLGTEMTKALAFPLAFLLFMVPTPGGVTVNRMWNELFGAGLVETTEDFGIMGQRPSHPELLDWLAVEFRESGWDMKHMYKLMVMSATYRQSGKSSHEQLAHDPKNLLLAHGPRFRMDAEMLRDIALQSSGLLVNKVGGPSVKPYQPANVWESVGYPTSDTTRYTQQHGDALYRRSLYTYWKRMAMAPDMDAFDAPTRDTACTRRQRTDTPLQALVTMNDPQWVEASRTLAERLIHQGGKQPAQRIQYLSELVLAHDPSPQMESVLQASLSHMEQHYAADPVAARVLIGVGEKPHDASIAPPELAAWTMVVSEVLNLDETLNK